MTHCYNVIYRVSDYFETYAVMIITQSQIQIHNRMNVKPLFSALLNYCDIFLDLNYIDLDNYVEQCEVLTSFNENLYSALKGGSPFPREHFSCINDYTTFKICFEAIDIIIQGLSLKEQRLPIQNCEIFRNGRTLVIEYKNESKDFEFDSVDECNDVFELATITQNIEKYLQDIDVEKCRENLIIRQQEQIEMRKEEDYDTVASISQNTSKFNVTRPNIERESLREIAMQSSEYYEKEEPSENLSNFQLDFVREEQENASIMSKSVNNEAVFDNVPIELSEENLLASAEEPDRAEQLNYSSNYSDRRQKFNPFRSAYDPGTLYKVPLQDDELASNNDNAAAGQLKAQQRSAPLEVVPNEFSQRQNMLDSIVQTDNEPVSEAPEYESLQSDSALQMIQKFKQNTSPLEQKGLNSNNYSRPDEAESQEYYGKQSLFSSPIRNQKCMYDNDNCELNQEPRNCFSNDQETQQVNYNMEHTDVEGSPKRSLFDYDLQLAIDILDGQFLAMLGKETVYLSFRIVGTILYVELRQKCVTKQVVQLKQIQVLNRNMEYVQFSLLSVEMSSIVLCMQPDQFDTMNKALQIIFEWSSNQ